MHSEMGRVTKPTPAISELLKMFGGLGPTWYKTGQSSNKDSCTVCLMYTVSEKKTFLNFYVSHGSAIKL